MGSRINSNLKHVFHCFMEVKPSSSDKPGKPGVVQCYPESYKEKVKIPDFVYPCTFTVTTVELFSFALTNMEGKLTFGFARHAPRADTALVVVSALPWHDFFYKLLNTCAQIMHNSGGEEEPDLLQKFLCDVYNSKLPRPGTDFSLEYGGHGKVFSSSTPDPTRLPSIPDNRNLSEYFNFVDMNNMITIFFSMLNERRVIVTSRKISRLTACVQAANSLLYPLSWQYLFIPVLPGPMIDFLTAPVPFVMGVPDVTLKRKPASEIAEVVILDADSNTVRNPFADVDIFPPEVLSNLKKSLKEKDKLGDHVARAFLQAMVHLIGGYRDAMRYRQGEKITFDSDAFIQSRSSSLQPFLEKLLQIQMFQTFKDERLELLNGGKGYSDEFELECVAFSEKASLRRFTPFDSVKKDGGALMKKVKNKTNPVMKNVIVGGKKAGERVRDSSKIAKSKAKATINEVKSKFRDNHEQFREDSSNSTHSAPSSPSQSRRSSVNNYQTLPSHGGGGNLPRQNTDLGLTTPASSSMITTTAPILKYERFDPTMMSSTLHSPSAPDNHLSPTASEDFNLMHDIDEVFNKQKPSAIYSHFGSIASGINTAGSMHATPKDNIRKPSVGDLINLSHDGDVGVESADIFDPLVTHPNPSSNQNTYSSFSKNTPSPNQNGFGGGGGTAAPGDVSSNHRKLSRTEALAGMVNSQQTNPSFPTASSNSFLYPTNQPHPRVQNNHQQQQQRISNNSQGKYENYVPPGGVSHQTQFKHFMSSMTDGSASGGHQALKRSSEDLLKDYGLLELSTSSLHLGSQAGGGQDSSLYGKSSPPYNNGLISSNSLATATTLAATSPSSVFQLNGYGTSSSRSASGSGNSFPQPPPRSSAMAPPPPTVSTQQRSASSVGGAIRNGHSGGNNSFLFNSSPIQPATNFQVNNMGGGSNLPVNQRLEPSASTASISGNKKKSIYSTTTTTNNNNHFLSDLDPLCSNGKPSLERTNLTPSPAADGAGGGFGGHRQPPAIPPRGKKQWTTFDN